MFRACTELGIRTVAVYSEQDTGQMHRYWSHKSSRISPVNSRVGSAAYRPWYANSLLETKASNGSIFLLSIDSCQLLVLKLALSRDISVQAITALWHAICVELFLSSITYRSFWLRLSDSLIIGINSLIKEDLEHLLMAMLTGLGCALIFPSSFGAYAHLYGVRSLLISFPSRWW